MSISDWLFGGNKQPTTTQTTGVQLGPHQQELYNTVFPQLLKQAQTPIQQYTGPQMTGFTPEEVTAQQKALQAATAAGTLGANAGAAQNQLLDPSFMLNPASNPHLQQIAQNNADLTTRNLLEKIMPSIRGGATQTGGMYSSGSNKEGIAEGMAAGQTSRAISDATTALYGDQYNRGMQTLQQAIGMNPSVQNQQLAEADITSGVGAQKRQLQDAMNQQQQANFYLSQTLPFLRSNEIAGMLGSLPGAQTVSTAQGSTPQSGHAMGALGGAATGAALGSFVPGIGTALGAGLGGLLGLLTNK